ncbi:MAG: hypothetical protein Q8P59_03600 [Dehalococcoidia bacterium]|nr:hypothetical protein [Dehalococcoidia bacterium]
MFEKALIILVLAVIFSLLSFGPAGFLARAAMIAPSVWHGLVDVETAYSLINY